MFYYSFFSPNPVSIRLGYYGKIIKAKKQPIGLFLYHPILYDR